MLLVNLHNDPHHGTASVGNVEMGFATLTWQGVSLKITKNDGVQIERSSFAEDVFFILSL